MLYPKNSFGHSKSQICSRVPCLDQHLVSFFGGVGGGVCLDYSSIPLCNDTVKIISKWNVYKQQNKETVNKHVKVNRFRDRFFFFLLASEKNEGSYREITFAMCSLIWYMHNFGDKVKSVIDLAKSHFETYFMIVSLHNLKWAQIWLSEKKTKDCLKPSEKSVVQWQNP